MLRAELQRPTQTGGPQRGPGLSARPPPPPALSLARSVRPALPRPAANQGTERSHERGGGRTRMPAKIRPGARAVGAASAPHGRELRHQPAAALLWVSWRDKEFSRRVSLALPPWAFLSCSPSSQSASPLRCFAVSPRQGWENWGAENMVEPS